MGSGKGAVGSFTSGLEEAAGVGARAGRRMSLPGIGCKGTGVESGGTLPSSSAGWPGSVSGTAWAGAVIKGSAGAGTDWAVGGRFSAVGRTGSCDTGSTGADETAGLADSSAGFSVSVVSCGGSGGRIKGGSSASKIMPVAGSLGAEAGCSGGGGRVKRLGKRGVVALGQRSITS